MDFVFLGAAFAFSLIATYFLLRSYERYYFRKAQEQGEILLKEVREQMEIQDIERQEFLKEVENSAWSKKEKEFQEVEDKVKQLQFTLHENQHKYKNLWHQKKRPLKHQQQHIERKKRTLQNLKKRIEQLEETLEQSNKNYREKLKERVSLETIEKWKKDIQSEEEKKILVKIKRNSIEMEERAKTENKKKAQHLMDIVFSRFKRACSAEKGILIPPIKTIKIQEMLLEETSPYREVLEKECKCELKVDQESQQIQIFTSDPVRKELVPPLL